MLGGYQELEVDFVANNPGLTLFHCHQQLHMDFGFSHLFAWAVTRDWQRFALTMLARVRGASAALAGVNASVVGILGAALYDPVWRSGVHDLADAVTGVAAFALLQRWRLPAPATIGLCVGISVARELASL